MDNNANQQPERGCDRHMVTITPVDGSSDRVNVGKLCGDNTGQHLYIHLHRNREMRESSMMMTPVMIMFSFTMNQPYTYNIMVTQLDHTRDEDMEKIAPAGCHQYFRNDTGELVSFNFNENAPMSSRYQPNLRYTMCIDPMGGRCQVTVFILILSHKPSLEDQVQFEKSE